MRPPGLVACLLLLGACGGANQPSTDVANPFPDVVLAEIDELGEDGEVTDVIEWKMVVVADGTHGPRAFRRADPNNGCRLALADDVDGADLHPDAVFFDPCHGKQYDVTGRPLGGSSGRAMTQLPTDVRDGRVVLVRDDLRERFERERADDSVDTGEDSG